MQKLVLLPALVLLVAVVGLSKCDSDDATLDISKCLTSNEPLLEVMEKVCEHCHEYYSDSEPNMRAKCRNGCFQNGEFKTCLSMFNNQNRARRSHRKHHHH